MSAVQYHYDPLCTPTITQKSFVNGTEGLAPFLTYDPIAMAFIIDTSSKSDIETYEISLEITMVNAYYTFVDRITFIATISERFNTSPFFAGSIQT